MDTGAEAESGGSCHLCPRCREARRGTQEGQVEVAGWPRLTSLSCTEALMCLPEDWHSVGLGAAPQPFFHDPLYLSGRGGMIQACEQYQFVHTS